VPLSRFWERFITEYSADKIYWYFPKGGTVDTAECRERFRIFQSFEGQKWTVELQQQFLDALHEANLSEANTTAFTRIAKRVYENLGLCWVEAGEPIRLTPAGRSYLRETGRSRILDAQVWRYQFPNPLNNIATTRGVSLFPHQALLELLLTCDGYITKQEFTLFPARMKRASEIGINTSRIRAWRRLGEETRDEILQRLAPTKFRTIDQDSSFILAFHRCDLLLEQRTDRLAVARENLNRLKNTLSQQKRQAVAIKTAVAINFRSEPDVIAFYGDTERQPTQTEALEYYIDISDVGKAVETFRSLPPAVRGQLTPEEFEKEQFLEKDLEDYLEGHLEEIEPGLQKIGRQHPTTVGPMDLFARAANGNLVVIELKKGRVADKVFGQICRYMGCVKTEHAGRDPNPGRAAKKWAGVNAGLGR
jgi:hypothetical protein